MRQCVRLRISHVCATIPYTIIRTAIGFPCIAVHTDVAETVALVPIIPEGVTS